MKNEIVIKYGITSVAFCAIVGFASEVYGASAPKGWEEIPSPINELSSEDKIYLIAYNVFIWLLGLGAMAGWLAIITGLIIYLSSGKDIEKGNKAKRLVKYGLILIIITGFAYAFFTPNSVLL